MNKKRNQDIERKLLNIKKEFDDTVVFRVGVKKESNKIDILDVENTFESEMEEGDSNCDNFRLPKKFIPDYIG